MLKNPGNRTGAKSMRAYNHLVVRWIAALAAQSALPQPARTADPDLQLRKGLTRIIVGRLN